MSERRESIFFASIRAFFVGAFGLGGMCFGLLVLVIGLAAISAGSDSDPDTSHNVKVLPDAEGNLAKLSKSDPVILRIDVKGLIGTDSLNMEKIRTLLVDSRYGDLKNHRVKAILLYLSSPGGTVTDSDGIYYALKEYKARYNVPVIAYVDGICTSGGLYVASAADKIYASEASLIGSVGVMMPTFLNVSNLMEKIGVETLTLSAGKGKDAMNPFRPWKEGEGSSYQSIVDYYYNAFLDIVTTNRPKLDKELLINEYGAQVFPAEKAQELGFIDATMNSLNDVLKQLVKDVGLEGKKHQVVRLEHKKWFSELLKSESSLFTGKVKHELHFPLELPPELMNQFLYLYRPELTFSEK